MSIQIIADSGCDITQEEAKKLGIRVLPIKTTFDETEYLDGVDLSHTEFFEKLIESDVFPKTSQISPFDYEQVYEEVKANGDVAIVISLSSKLSGCFQSANIAASDYEGIIYPFDSLSVTIGQRILIEHAVALRDKGCTLEEILASLEEKKHHVKLIALLDTLEYLRKGGRISAAAAAAGSLLSIKPVIAIEEGEVAVLGKARGSKAGNNMLRQMIDKEGPIDFSMPVALAYSGLNNDVLMKYKKDHHDLYDQAVPDLPDYSIGCAIGTHIGPGAIALAFFQS